MISETCGSGHTKLQSAKIEHGIAQAQRPNMLESVFWPLEASKLEVPNRLGAKRLEPERMLCGV